MKKFYLICAAVCAVASASAVEKEMQTAPVQLSVSPVKMSSPMKNLSSKAKAVELKKSASEKTRAGEVEYTFYRPANEVMSIGMTSKGYGFNGTLGFASSYGNVDFINLSTGASSFVWNFTDVIDPENVKTSSNYDLSVKAGVGDMMTPVLNASYASGESGSYSEAKDAYLIGGSANYWLGPNQEESGVKGLTFYQNVDMVNPQGYTGQVNIVNTYYPGLKNFNENGVFNSWTQDIEEELGVPVTDLTLNSYTILQPKPASTYFFTKGWLWVDMSTTADTQLISYVYPVDEVGEKAELPIAIGYAGVSMGEVNFLVFDYYPLNEDGDELEGEVFVDSAVEITVEGFNGNPAVTYMSPIAGYYPFPIDAYRAGNYDLWKEPNLYLDLSFVADGDLYNASLYDGSAYYFDQRDEKPGVTLDRNTISPMCYCVFTMNASYPFIHGVDGTDEVTIPIEGGEATVEIEALYYEIKALLEEGVYVLQAPEWLKVEVSEPNEQTGTTTLTVSAAAGEDRTGVVTIEGLGATYSLTVNQGAGNAVSSIVVDKSAEYFDLQGRRVANPDKGIYIKKTANKTEKVIL